MGSCAERILFPLWKALNFASSECIQICRILTNNVKSHLSAEHTHRFFLASVVSRSLPVAPPPNWGLAVCTYEIAMFLLFALINLVDNQNEWIASNIGFFVHFSPSLKGRGCTKREKIQTFSRGEKPVTHP